MGEIMNIYKTFTVQCVEQETLKQWILRVQLCILQVTYRVCCDSWNSVVLTTRRSAATDHNEKPAVILLLSADFIVLCR